MAKKEIGKNMLSGYKKDSVGLFKGGFKAEKFETKTEREERRRKRTSEILSEVDEDMDDVYE